MAARHVFYEGRVQGVGFRYTVKRIARGFDVVGWVRNLDDGRVELQVSGDEAEVESFLEDITESELKSHIKKVEVQTIPPLQGVKGFDIVG
jgi:acylphosphatase